MDYLTLPLLLYPSFRSEPASELQSDRARAFLFGLRASDGPLGAGLAQISVFDGGLREYGF